MMFDSTRDTPAAYIISDLSTSRFERIDKSCALISSALESSSISSVWSDILRSRFETVFLVFSLAL